MNLCLFILERYKSSSVSFCALIFILLQNGRGRPPAQEQWVFGMVDTSSRPAVGYMELVHDNVLY